MATTGSKKLLPLAERIFVGTFPTGISYADRSVEVGDDYKRLAFLPFSTLVLEWYAKRVSPDVRDYVERDAAKIQSRRGQDHPVSSSGQTVVLGGPGAKKTPAQLEREVRSAASSSDVATVDDLYADRRKKRVTLEMREPLSLLDASLSRAQGVIGSHITVQGLSDTDPVAYELGNDAFRQLEELRRRIRRAIGLT